MVLVGVLLALHSLATGRQCPELVAHLTLQIQSQLFVFIVLKAHRQNIRRILVVLHKALDIYFEVLHIRVSIWGKQKLDELAERCRFRKSDASGDVIVKQKIWLSFCEKSFLFVVVL